MAAATRAQRAAGRMELRRRLVMRRRQNPLIAGDRAFRGGGRDRGGASARDGREGGRKPPHTSMCLVT